MRIAGIGSRQTPMPVLAQIEQAAMQLALRGFLGVSGGADGADTAFERGWTVINRDTFTKYPASTGHYLSWQRLAALYHPAWDSCNEFARKAHARNCAIVLGPSLDMPVSAILCWTPDGAITGGTGQALRVAEAYKIPVFNLATVSIETFWEFVS